MKICMVVPFFYPFRGGIENYVLDLSKYLVNKGHKVSVITAREKGQPKYNKEFGIDVYRVPSIVSYKLPSIFPPPYSLQPGFTYFGYKLLKKINPDFIHMHNRYFIGFYPIILHKKLLDKKLFLTIHNSRPEDINKQTNLLSGIYDDSLGNFLMNNCNHIFGNSQYSLDVTIPKKYSKKKTSVAYNGLYTDEWKRVKTNLKDDFGVENLLLTDLRLVPQKGAEYLINAIENIDDSHLIIKGRFEASGYGYEKQIKKLIHKKKLKDKVTIMSQRLSEEEMIELYSAADQFILPSLHEPFGIVLIQAMATNTPIVTTNVGGILEVVDNTAITVKSRSSKLLKKGIETYINDKKLAKKNAKNARKRVVDNFDWKIVGRQVEKVYEDFYEKK